ncbi:hypothetical protein BC832DRAFT_537630 [Gaertneriomyces semiglobifer]|nr:hypothetical protein BC832DRAFT_537630 [Gaertneriomyces semiglobifer]
MTFRYWKSGHVTAKLNSLRTALFDHLRENPVTGPNQNSSSAQLSISVKELASFISALIHYPYEQLPHAPAEPDEANAEDELDADDWEETSNNKYNGSTRRHRHLVRIPVKLFKDFSAQGSLYTILRAAYTWRIKHGLRRWDLDNPARRASHALLIRYIAEVLAHEGFLRYPVLTFGRSLSDHVRDEIRRLAPQAQCIVHEYMTKDVTHILQHAPEHDNIRETTASRNSSDNLQSSETEWYRTLDKRDGYVLLHYWYKPDSSDKWVSQASGEFLDPEPAPEHQGPWYLSVNWLRDSVRFAEWMNEEDYEAEEPDELEEHLEDVMDGEESDIGSDLDVDSKSVHSMRSNAKSFRSNDPDDDQMSLADEEMEAANDGPIPYPIVNPVDLNRKGIRSKKYEYEPIPNAILHNISQPLRIPLPARHLKRNRTGDGEEEDRWEFLGRMRRKTELNIIPKQDSDADQKQGDSQAVKSEDVEHPFPPVDSVADSPTSVSTAMDVDNQPSPTPAASSDPIRSVSFPPILPGHIPDAPEWIKAHPDTVSDIEITHFPDTQVSDYAERYIFLRNAMIRAYWNAPFRSLSIAECWDVFGDYDNTINFCDVVKVSMWLESWSLINVFGLIGEDAPEGVESTLAGLLRLQRKDMMECDPVYKSPLVPRDVVKQADLSAIQMTRRKCWYCSTSLPTAKDILPEPYYCLAVNYDICLCLSCFQSGCYPYDVSSSSFIAVKPVPNVAEVERILPAKTDDVPQSQWGHEERLLLMEAIEAQHQSGMPNGRGEARKTGNMDALNLCGIDWRGVSQFVGTRSPEECIYEFARIPIEDQFLNASSGVIDSDQQGNVAPLSSSPTAPWSGTVLEYADNPVMSFLRFISREVNPSVAAAGAKSVLEAVSRESQQTNGSGQPSMQTLNAACPPDSVIAEPERSDSSTESATNLRLELLFEGLVQASRDAARELAVYEDGQARLLVRELVECTLEKVERKRAFIKCLDEALGNASTIV